MPRRYCTGCNRKHTIEEVGGTFWSTRQRGQKTLYYCRLAIDCTGCRTIHTNTTGYTTINSKGSFCGKWAKPKQSMAKKIDSLSPQEVLSGVQYGLPEQKVFTDRAANTDHRDIHRDSVKAIKETLG